MSSIPDATCEESSKIQIEFSPLVLESAALKLFQDMSKQQISYCIWKSIDRFEEGVRGETDFDLLVAEGHLNRLRSFLSDQQWIELRAERWRSFPGIYDFVCYDRNFGRFLHLHVHTQIITGAERIKSIVLPVAELYLKHTSELHGVVYVAPELEFVSFILRTARKFSILKHSMRLLAGRGNLLDKFVFEYEFIKQRTSRDAVQKVLEQAGLAFVPNGVVMRAFDDLHTLNSTARAEINHALRPYQRYSTDQRTLLKIIRFVQRRLEGCGKYSTHALPNFAVIGPDGSGKSTLVRNLVTNLSQHLRVRRVYMGGSQRSCGPARRLLRLTIFPCVALLRRALELLNLPHLSKNLRRSYYALEQRLILAEKQSRYRAAKKAQTRGELVLFERFPLFDGYGDAAPDRTHDGQPLESPLQIQYAKFNRPDVLIALSVSEELALKRKNDSAHISSELANKVKAFEQYYSTHKEDNEGNILVLDTSMEKQSTLDAALQHIWSNISSVVAAANADTS